MAGGSSSLSFPLRLDTFLTALEAGSRSVSGSEVVAAFDFAARGRRARVGNAALTTFIALVMHFLGGIVAIGGGGRVV